MEISEFISSIKEINWFSKSGFPSNKYHVIHSLFEAYDNWNSKYLEVWLPKTKHLEMIARKAMGDKWIDDCFSEISSAIYDILWEKFCQFIERQSLYEESGIENELIDMVIRDLSWAYIEQYLNEGIFFSSLIQIYIEGYFPCAWDGTYPDGIFVVI